MDYLNVLTSKEHNSAITPHCSFLKISFMPLELIIFPIFLAIPVNSISFSSQKKFKKNSWKLKVIVPKDCNHWIASTTSKPPIGMERIKLFNTYYIFFVLFVLLTSAREWEITVSSNRKYESSISILEIWSSKVSLFWSNCIPRDWVLVLRQYKTNLIHTHIYYIYTYILYTFLICFSLTSKQMYSFLSERDKQWRSGSEKKRAFSEIGYFIITEEVERINQCHGRVRPDSGIN